MSVTVLVDILGTKKGNFHAYLASIFQMYFFLLITEVREFKQVVI